MSNNIRTVWESVQFIKERKKLNPDIQRMDEILDGVTWVLAVRPELGKRTNNPLIWAIATVPWTTASFVIYYSFDENEVVLKAIKRSVSPNDE